MIEAAFISDLHLHPEQALLEERFHRFLRWAAQHVRSLYILGDFFHAWAGDDGLDAWSMGIVRGLSTLVAQGIPVYFMAGNRDFLVGDDFMHRAGMQGLCEPAVIEMGEQRVLLVHGDRYCTRDWMHQIFRRLTRNQWFPWLFLKLPLAWREQWVARIRHYSATQGQDRNMSKGVIEHSCLLNHMQQKGTKTVIHGHIHRPGLTVHEKHHVVYHQYVLSDWDDEPLILCYDEINGYYYNHID